MSKISSNLRFHGSKKELRARTVMAKVVIGLVVMSLSFAGCTSPQAQQPRPATARSQPTTTSDKAPLKKEAPNRASDRPQVSTGVTLTSGRAVSSPMHPAHMLMTAQSPDKFTGYWVVDSQGFTKGTTLAMLDTPGGTCRDSRFPITDTLKVDFEKKALSYWGKEETNAKYVTRASVKMGGHAEYWELYYARSGDTVCGKASWDLQKNKHDSEVYFPEGSTIRFDDSDWVHFCGAKFKSGGFRIGQGKIQFLPGTQVLSGTSVLKFTGTDWE